MSHHPIRKIVVHCTASPVNTTREMVDEWHRARGWAGIGYHYLIQAGGIVRKGRPDHLPGAHARGHNTGSLGVCVSGDTRAGHPWSYDQERQLVLLLADLCRAYRLDSSAVVGHCELDPEGKPDCPGVDMGAIRERVRVRLEATT